ncbi:MAG: Uma2 family endonuclease [Leptolyngbyaceae cyanobacterium SL_7_1]|nr:Uma2 family endonuclease [Leptolyngbyaceae cyanobacterium SL_7_1]
MIVTTPTPHRFSPADYLTWEAQQPLKYEYLQGVAYAMTGGTLAYNSIAVNLTTALKPHLRGKGCKVFMADAKVEVSSQGPYFYPDVVVTCHPHDQHANDLIRDPSVIIEVLSPSTASFDRGDKFKCYRRIPTLQDYVLVDAEQVSVDCYRRQASGTWELLPLPSDATSDSLDGELFRLASLDFECPLSLIYEGVDLLDVPPYQSLLNL